MKPVLIVLILLISVSVVNAQQLDRTYHPEMIRRIINNNFALQNNGKVVVAGNFTIANGISRYSIARINTDGSLDEDFNTGDGPDNYISLVVPGTGGKLTVIGEFNMFSGTEAHNLVRLHSDGSLDQTFNAGTGPDGLIYDADSAGGGKIIVAGNFTSIDNTPVNFIARLNNDGTADQTFNSPTGLAGFSTAIAVREDGMIYLLINGNEVVRLDPEGNVDNTFTFGTHNFSFGAIFALQPLDDGVLLGGYFSDIDNSGNENLIKILDNGDVDTEFNPGSAISGQINVIARLSSGKIIAGGGFTEYENTPANLISMNEDGTLSAVLATMDNNAIHFIGVSSALNQTFIGVEFELFNELHFGGLVKLNNGLTANENYVPEFSNESIVEWMDLDKDNKLVVAATDDRFEDSSVPLARINADGSRDTEFIPPLSDNAEITALKNLDDGSILIGGMIRPGISRISDKTES